MQNSKPLNMLKKIFLMILYSILLIVDYYLFFHWHYIYDCLNVEILGGGVLIILLAVFLLYVLVYLWYKLKFFRRTLLIVTVSVCILIIGINLFPDIYFRESIRKHWQKDSVFISENLNKRLAGLCDPFDSTVYFFELQNPHYSKNGNLLLIPVIAGKERESKSQIKCLWILAKRNNDLLTLFLYKKSGLINKEDLSETINIKNPQEGLGNYFYIPGSNIRNPSFWRIAMINIKYKVDNAHELENCEI